MIKEHLSNQDYHSDHEYVSKSWLDALRKNPAKLQEYLRSGNEQTTAMRVGSMVHTAILEPELFKERYALAPICDKRTKEGKAIYQKFEEENQGKEFCKQDELEMIQGMNRSLLQHSQASNLLYENGRCELSVFSELNGVKVKCRFDKLTESGIAIDIKTTEDASITEFAKSIYNYRYHVQAAFYRDIAENEDLELKRFIFIAIEKSPPYCVACYELDEDSVTLGMREYQDQLDLYKSCLELDSWPAYGQEIEKISLPKWALNK